jgi:hypothetical protein
MVAGVKHAEFKARLTAYVESMTPDRREGAAILADLAIEHATHGVDPDRAHWPEGFKERADKRASEVAAAPPDP